MTPKIPINKKEDTMPNPKRCKSCNKEIDDNAELCSACQLNFNKSNRMYVDMENLKIKTDLFVAEYSDRIRDAHRNECIQPPMPWKKD